MKVIIAGSRTINDYLIVYNAIQQSNFDITEVISGGCRGPDLLAEQWAKEYNIPIKRFDANWKKYGKSAGPIRNIDMILKGHAEALILIWDGKSPGSKNMKEQAKKYNLKIYEFIYK